MNDGAGSHMTVTQFMMGMFHFNFKHTAGETQASLWLITKGIEYIHSHLLCRYLKQDNGVISMSNLLKE